MQKRHTWIDLFGTLYLVIALCFLGSILISTWIHNRNEQPYHLTRQFEEILQIHEGHLITELRKLSDSIKEIKAFYRGNDLQFSLEKPKDDELTLFIYKGDSLIFWSDNRIPFYDSPDRFDDEIPAIIRVKNGWYEVLKTSLDSISLLGFCLIRQEFPFQNQYLENQFTDRFSIPAVTEISLIPGPFNIHSSRGNFLCSLVFHEPLTKAIPPAAWIFLVLGFYLFYIAFTDRCFLWINQFIQHKKLVLLICFADILLLRTMQLIFKWPELVYRSELFNPAVYSSTWLFPSLGDFLINSFVILGIVCIYFQRWPSGIWKRATTKFHRAIVFVSIVITSSTVLALILAGVKSLVFHSTLPLNLENISQFSVAGGIAFLSISILAVAWILIVIRLSHPQATTGSINDNHSLKSSWNIVLSALILFSVCTAYVLYDANSDREKQKRELIAQKLIIKQNPVTENLLQQTMHRISADSLILNGHFLIGTEDYSVVDDSLTKYILRNYFRDYWNNFSLQITVCKRGKTLRIQPQGIVMNCGDYFSHIIKSFGDPVDDQGIFFIDYGFGSENYLARLSLPPGETILYIELVALNPFQDLGYPELLMDRSFYNFPDLTGYSYAYFQDNQLVQRAGEYAYGFRLDRYVTEGKNETFFELDGMDHFLYQVDDHNVLLISKPRSTFFNTISPFSYLLIFFSLITFLVFIILRPKQILSLPIRSLRNRIQIFILGFILSSFVIIGILILVYLVRLDTEKNEENLKERTLSILIEMEHKFGQTSQLADIGREDLENVLVKFSNVFFSDINLYSPEGILTASSRPRIFNEGLISDRINAKAFNRLVIEGASLFTQTECIGKLCYLSAYVPFYNYQNNLLAYLNLPYFSKQDDLQREISTFLVTFINFYVIFLLLGVFITYFISGYITSPLKILALRISNIRIGKANDKLDWKREDEIGKLVVEYNRMLDELSVSAEKLASNERAAAWREMAQQVAHEIKNPLTPMKLSIQHLVKAWDAMAPDREIRLKRLADALIEQIDSMSVIASEFSYFAKMPVPRIEKLDLDEFIHTSLGMYKNVAGIDIQFLPTDAKKWIFADHKQLVRVLSNLINNAIQALENRSNGKILLKTETIPEYHVLEVSDNGKGIPVTETDKIFQPNFTTRSGGTGLGLAIVREIIVASGGQISFHSVPDTGTTFRIMFPSALPATDKKPEA